MLGVSRTTFSIRLKRDLDSSTIDTMFAGFQVEQFDPDPNSRFLPSRTYFVTVAAEKVIDTAEHFRRKYSANVYSTTVLGKGIQY